CEKSNKHNLSICPRVQPSMKLQMKLFQSLNSIIINMKSIITQRGLDLLKERLKEKKESLKDLQEEKAHAYSASGDGWHDNPGWTQLGQQEELLSAEIAKLERKLSNIVLVDRNKLVD